MIVAFGLMWALTTQSTAQQAPSQQGVIRVNVNLVQIDAVVTDGKGRPVRDLSAEDFEVFQDGRLQVITNFSFINVKDRSVSFDPPKPVADQPKKGPPLPPPPPITLRPDQIRRTMALVVDDLALSFDSTVHVREALRKWVDQEMQPGDLVAVIRTSAGMGSLQQFTSNKPQLYAAIDLVRYQLGRVGVSSFGPLTGAVPAGSIDTSAFDDEVRYSYLLGSLGAIQYVLQGLRDMPGRKSMILFSENMQLDFLQGNNLVNTFSMTDQTSEERLRRIADAANRSSVVISAVDPRGVVYTGLTAEDNTSGMTDAQIAQVASQRTQSLIASQDGMVMLSQKTGGLFVSGNNDIAGALREVVDDGDGYYLIGYQPDDSTFDAKAAQRFHSISVRVKRPGLHVRSRTGFFGTPDTRTAPAPETRQAQIARALVSPFSTGAMRVRLTTLFSNAEKQGSYINALLYIDAHDLTFNQEPDGARMATIDIVAATFDADGRAVDSVVRTWQFRFQEKRYEEILRTGLVYSAHLPVKKAGPYQMRVVLRDATSQQLGSATRFIEVPDVGKGRLTLSGIVLSAQQQTPAAGEPAEGQVAAADPNGTAAVRIFKPGAAIVYNYQILNARADRDKKPQLVAQIRLFRDGQQVYASMPAPVSSDKQPDPKRLIGAGSFQLTRVPPGDYLLQVVIMDKLRKEKDSVAAQSVDFQVR